MNRKNVTTGVASNVIHIRDAINLNVRSIKRGNYGKVRMQLPAGLRLLIDLVRELKPLGL